MNHQHDTCFQRYNTMNTSAELTKDDTYYFEDGNCVLRVEGYLFNVSAPRLVDRKHRCLAIAYQASPHYSSQKFCILFEHVLITSSFKFPKNGWK